METSQIFQILVLVFGGLSLLWNQVIRHKIDNWNDRAGLIEFYTGLHEFLGKLSFHHKRVSGVLLGIALIFGIIAILVS